MNDVVCGIVLKQSQYRENDLLISVLTEQWGRLSLVARGAKKVTSKNAVSCTPFVVSEYLLDFKEGKTMYTLKNGVLLESNRHVRSNLEKVHVAQLFAELVEAMIPQGVEEDEVSAMTFELFRFTLQQLDKSETNFLPLAFFLAKNLDIQGVSPVVDGCVFCGSTAIQGIDREAGGFICQQCAKNAPNLQFQDTESLKRFRLINKAQIEHYDILANQATWTIQDVEFLIEFLQEHTGIYCQSWLFLKDLLKD